MSDDPREQFVRFVRGHGIDVRGVLHYDDDETELLYVRDDVHGETFERRVVVTTRQALYKYRHDDADETFGGSEAHVELFDQVTTIHLRTRNSAGLVLSIEVSSLAKVDVFVEKCRELLSASTDATNSSLAEDRRGISD